MKDYITPIKNDLDNCMHFVCSMFMAIGTPLETPRYFNFKKFDEETKKLTIGSTQREKLFFKVQTDFNHVHVEDFWVQFRVYRTAFLKEHYPTINPY
jgi:hypothetical protein